MASFETFVGLAAAACTTVSYVPQVRKARATRSVGDLSWTMLALLAGGLSLWIVYGWMKADWVIVGSNAIGVSCLAYLLSWKARERGAAAEGPQAVRGRTAAGPGAR